MDWHTYSVFFALFLFAVVIDTWTPFGPAPYYASKIAIRVVVACIGVLWILSGLGLGFRF